MPAKEPLHRLCGMYLACVEKMQSVVPAVFWESVKDEIERSCFGCDMCQVKHESWTTGVLCDFMYFI